jgi:hypothetical protein
MYLYCTTFDGLATAEDRLYYLTAVLTSLTIYFVGGHVYDMMMRMYRYEYIGAIETNEVSLSYFFL